jgi:hypothetical protein
LLPEEIVFCEQHCFESGDFRVQNECFHCWDLSAGSRP